MLSGDNEFATITLSREMAKIHKKVFGKGPTGINVVIRPSMAIIRSDGVLTELERNLLDTERGPKTVVEIRSDLIERFKVEILQVLSSAVGIKFSELMAELFISTDELIVVLS